MATEMNLPNNDPDLLLAQAVGEVLDSYGSFQTIEDPLIDQLLEYKNLELADIEIDQEISSTIWSKIESETKPQPAKITPLFSRPSTFAWASAAVILIAAFIGLFWITSQPQLELVAESGDSLETITLIDGSVVTLRPNSKLFHVANLTDERAYSLSGEAFFDVVSNANSPFSVDAEFGTVTVLGTRFNLSTWGGKSIVYLEEGSIQFESNLTDEAIVLSPGESSEIVDGEIQLLTEADSDVYTDWISGTIIFDNNSPLEIVFELNQHFGVNINIDALIDQTGISGTLGLESIEQTLQDLGLVLGGSFRMVSDNEYEFMSME